MQGNKAQKNVYSYHSYEVLHLEKWRRMRKVQVHDMNMIFH